MRLLVLAVGHARGTSEGALIDDYIARANAFGKRLGLSSTTVEEVASPNCARPARASPKKASDWRRAFPRSSHVIFCDARGKGMTSEAFAEMIGAMRDAGARDLVFLLGGPDGLDPGPSVKAARSLAFGPQTWPHLLVRAMLAEQLYRSLTILGGHPYHRA